MAQQQFSVKQILKRNLPWLFAVAMTAPAVSYSAELKLEFQTPGRFADLGVTDEERKRNLNIFAQSFTLLAQSLPSDNTLKVRVVDVDLAGGVRVMETRDGPQAIRFMRSDSASSMNFEYNLVDAEGNLIKTDQVSLRGPDARQHGRFGRWGYRDDREPLLEEREMLTEWFSRTFESS